MKAFKLVLGALLISGVAAIAQETSTTKFEAGLTYSWLHVYSANVNLQRTENGGSGYFEYNLKKTVGIVADFGGYANTRAGIDETLTTHLFGPRFQLAQFAFESLRAVPFRCCARVEQPHRDIGHAERLRYFWTRHISIKPVQVAYVTTQISSPERTSSHPNDARHSAGVVFEFGERH